MAVDQQKRSTEQGKEEPGSMDSFNHRNTEKSTATEDVKEKKDESESFMDYNGNSEANAPARARE
jgi:hypothetical protein